MPPKGSVESIRNVTVNLCPQNLETMFSSLGDWRCVVTRYDRCAQNFMSKIHNAEGFIFYPRKRRLQKLYDIAYCIYLYISLMTCSWALPLSPSWPHASNFRSTQFPRFSRHTITLRRRSTSSCAPQNIANAIPLSIVVSERVPVISAVHPVWVREPRCVLVWRSD